MPTISLALGERSYDIHVENGALDRTGEFAYRAGLDGKIALITDSRVAPLYAERVMKSLESAGFMPSHARSTFPITASRSGQEGF